jgi:hypothetical protein
MNNGHYIIGTFFGYFESEWESANGHKGTNRTVALVTNTYKDQFGRDQEDITSVEVSQDHANYYKSHLEEYKGKQVMLPVVPRAKVGGKNGAWLQFFQPKESEISTLTEPHRKRA